MEHQFQVEGMTCGHCEMAVKKALSRLDQQAEIQIDRAHKLVTVKSDQPRDKLSQAITEEGYQVA